MHIFESNNILMAALSILNESWRNVSKLRFSQINLSYIDSLQINLLFFILKFNGVTSFLFSLEEIRSRAGTKDLVGTHLIARALVKVRNYLEKK